MPRSHPQPRIAHVGCSRQPCYDDLADCPGPIPAQPCNACRNSGKPTSLTFDITGGGATGAGSIQEGKGGSTGGTIAGGGSYTASCTNSNAQLSGTTLVVGGFSDNDIYCTVSDGTQTQVINFHVSCSKRLITEDQFGAMQLTSFVDSRGSSGDASCEDRPAPPCELCCQLPPTITTPASRRIVNKLGCVENGLPAEIMADLQLWFDSNGGAVCTSNNIGGAVEWTAANAIGDPLDAARIAQTLCNLETEDYCPEKIVYFTCCDPCDPEFACETTSATYEIGFESEAEITEQCTATPPAPPPDGPCDVCVNRGKPMSLTFDITGGGTTGAGSIQEGKGGSTGGTIAGGGSYTASCTNSNAQLSGTTLVVGGFSDNDIYCTVSDGTQTQVINFHVSCSKRLITEDQFGAMQLTSFVDSGGRSSCSGSSWNSNLYYGNWHGTPNDPPGPQPERECYLCCVMPPVLDVPADIELPKIERCTEAGTLPTATKTALAIWLDSKRCATMNHDDAVPIEMVRVNFESITLPFTEFSNGFTIDDLEQAICQAEGESDNFPKCPVVNVEFSCCDPCAPDDTPFDGLDEGALCGVGSSMASVVDDVPPVIDGENRGVRCSLEGGANDAQFSAWLGTHSCSDAQSPGSGWDTETPYLSTEGTRTITDDVCAIVTEVDYACMDECRNDAAPVTLTFRVRDNVDPEVRVSPQNLELECGDPENEDAINNWLDSAGGAEVADCNDVTWQSVQGDWDNSCPNSTSVDFVFSDPCGGTVTDTATVVVADTIPPTIECEEIDDCEDVTEIECDGQTDYNIDLWLQANGHLTCSDSCSATVSWGTPALLSSAGTAPCVDLRVYGFTCTDACGNAETYQLTLTVTDTVGPIIEQYPASETVECDGAGNTAERQAFLTRWGTGGDTGIRWANDGCSPNPICHGAYGARLMEQSGYANCGYCAPTEDQVCSAGVTYPNSCFAYCNGRHSFDNGACSDDVTTEAPAYVAPPADTACSYCSDEHTPVCVGGTLQFQNFCQAYCHNHWHFTVGACSNYGDTPETTQPPSCTETCGAYVSPVCGSNGDNYVSSCHAACDNVYNYQAGECPESCGEDPLTYSYDVVDEGDSPGCQTMEVMFTAEDPCGNPSVAHPATFTEVDTTPPDITTAAADTTVECDGDGNFIEFNDWVTQRAGAECSDSCSGEQVEWAVNGIVGGTFVENGYNHVCGSDCPFDRCLLMSWTCTDSCGHVSETSAKFVIVDTTPPSLSVVPVHIDECGAGPNQATAWAMPPLEIALSSDDSCDYCQPGDPIEAQCDFSKQPVVTANLLGGSHRGPPYFWREADEFKVNLPVVPAAGVTGQSPSTLDAATRQYIIDNAQGNLDFDGDSRCPLITTMELQAADACLNEGTTAMAYHVHVDTTDPIWTSLPQDQTVECDRSSTSNDDAFQAFLANTGSGACEDSCNFGPVSMGHVTPLADPVAGAPGYSNSCPNSRPVVFFCEDFCGNRIEHTVEFHVQDTQPPVIPSIPDTTIECGPNVENRLASWAERKRTDVAATDTCTRSARLTAVAETGPLRVIDGTPSTCSDRYARTMFTISDECDNAASDPARFYMIDSTPPDIMGPGVDLDYTCSDQCTNRNFIARGLYMKWIAQARGCLTAEDCQEDMTWVTENGPQNISELCGTSGSVDFVVTDGCGHSSRRSLNYNFGLQVSPPPPPPQPCEICSRQNKERLRSLSFRWDSNSGGGTQVTAQGLGSFSAADGGIVTVTTGYKFSSNMVLSVSDGGSRTVHVSCSVLLTIGQTVSFGGAGTLTIIGFRTAGGRTEATCPGATSVGSEPAFCEYPIDSVDVCDCVPQPAPPPGPLEDVCDSVSRPTQLTFTYRGGNALTNPQLKNGDPKASVAGGVPTGTADTISCMGGSGRGGRVNAFTDVAIGDVVEIGVRWSEIGTELSCTVRSGSVTQVIEIHTSCSMPLNTGDIFGSLQLSCFWNGASQSCSSQPGGDSAGCALPPTPPPPSGGDCAACGGDRYASGGGGRVRPSVLTFRYITGFDVTNLQSGKASVSPTTAAAGSATIQCTGGSAQSVSVGGEFTVGSAGLELGTWTTCSVMSNTGTQVVTIHTSCSAPLSIGDVYGSIVLISFSRSDGAFNSESAACPARRAPGGAGGNSNLSPPSNDDDGGDDDGDDFDDDDEVGADSCDYVNPCEAIEENGGTLQSMTLQFVASNGGRFVHSQGTFGAQQSYEVLNNGATRVKVGGSVRQTWNLRDGDVFRIDATASGVTKIPNQLSFLVGTGDSKARIRFQTNCKRELTIGDIFGVLKIVGFTTSHHSCETEAISSNIAAAAAVSTHGSSIGASSIAGIVVGSMLVVVVVVGVFRASTMHTERATMLTIETSEPSTASRSDLHWDNAVHDSSKLGQRSNTKNMEEGSVNSGV